MIEMKDSLKRFVKHPIVINLILLAAVSGLLLVGVLKWLDHYTQHNVVVVVPDVKGLTMDDAAPFFQNNSLRYNVIDSVFSKEVAPGAIVELAPNVGSKVKKGRIVFVTINATTSQTSPMPEIEDLSLRQAYALLKSRGFTSIEVEYVPGMYKDLAIAVESNGRTIPANERVLLTAPLVLKVSGGMDFELDSLSLDSLALDSLPVEALNSDLESWF